MTTARRVATRYLLARRVPLTVDRIRQVQKDAETFARNVELVDNEADRDRVADAANTWRNATRPLYDGALAFSIALRDKDFEKGERQHKTWTKKFEPLFDVIMHVSQIPPWTSWKRPLKWDWLNKTRALASSLDGVVTFLGTLAKKKQTPTVHERTTEKRTLEGFEVDLVEFDGDDPSHREALEGLTRGFKEYRRRAQEVLPLLLKQRVGFDVDFSIDNGLLGGLGGGYGDGRIDVNPFAWGGKPKAMTYALAHEMGHHLYRRWMKAPQQAFWRSALEKDWTELDLTEVLALWQRGDNWYQFILDVRDSEPLLYLQLEGALKHSNAMPKELGEIPTREALVDYLARGRRTIRVPASPITAYAATNPSEAFSEALASLVAYGPRALLPLVRQWLAVIFEGHVKLAQYGGLRKPAVAR